jgi:hypothetical protein
MKNTVEESKLVKRIPLKNVDSRNKRSGKRAREDLTKVKKEDGVTENSTLQYGSLGVQG